MKNTAEIFLTTLAQLFKTSTFAMADYSSPTFRTSSQNTFSPNGTMGFKKFKRFFKRSTFLPFALVGIVIIILAVILVKNAVDKPTAQTTLGSSTAKVSPVAIAKPLATETLNKNFDFPLRDVNGKEVSKIHYEIQGAELDNQIVVKGQLATAVQGRAFLILNLKITNDYNKNVQLNTRDYIRLVVDNSSDKLAADVHNDPVSIDAISTKNTRLGFAVNSNVNSLKLEVGEIAGPKKTVTLNLK